MPNFASKDRTIMNNKLNIKIEQLKNINNIELNLPIETGLYAITGANGSINGITMGKRGLCT